jgi:3',5'-cyclic AMP phosphodiesterase CpdA
MTQPNVYWTLDAPFVTMIGLYSNVPEGGQFDQAQLAWFVNELSTAPKKNAVVVSLHHPPFSADAHHAGSQAMVNALDDAFQKSGRTADLVLTGHVHNYQRFTRRMDGSWDLPYVVAGAGGYWNLHTMQKQPNGSPLQVPAAMPEPNVTLENYCANMHGYLLIHVMADSIGGEYYAVPSTTQPAPAKGQLIDAFEVDLRQHKLTKSAITPSTMRVAA